MNATEKEIQIGGSYVHTLFGNCIVLYRNSRGYWIQCWGGPSGDKLYTHKGIKASDLKPRDSK
jgi:hypothetical protein